MYNPYKQTNNFYKENLQSPEWSKALLYSERINEMDYMSDDERQELRACIDREYRRVYKDVELWRYYRSLFLRFNQNISVGAGASNDYYYDYIDYCNEYN